MSAAGVWRGAAQMLTGALIGAGMAVAVVGTAMLTGPETAPLSRPESTPLSAVESTRGDTDETIRPLIEEDDPRWDCHSDGNRICGGNMNGLDVLSAYLRSSGTVLS